MLADYLDSSVLHPVLPGILCAPVSLHPARSSAHSGLMQSERMEVFFCRHGSFLVNRRSSPEIHVESQDILMFCTGCDLQDVLITSPVDGIYFSFELNAVSKNFDLFCSSFALSVSCEQVLALFDSCGGCCCTHSSAWNRTVFSVLQCLPCQQQEQYCMMKTFELFYLLCIKSSLLESSSALSPNWGYLAHTVSLMRTYMEEHLEKKLTISFLCSRFHISPTAFKSCFRALYGQPVHGWLLEKRLERAAVLLSGTSMTVLQIAQEVGYESVGQFNVVFKRKYGMTPTQYKKISYSNRF